MVDVEREEKLKSAKLKLKAFRAKKAGHDTRAKRSSITSAMSLSSEDPSTSSSARPSLDSPTRKSRHSHRRSSVRQSIVVAPVAPALPAQPNPQTARRSSTRRHSRTESICSTHNLITELSQPAAAANGLNTWTFPRSPLMPASSSPELVSSPFASGSRGTLQPRRASLQHPPLSPSAGAAAIQSTSATIVRRTSLQVDVPVASRSPNMSPAVGMPSFGHAMSSASTHARRNSRHSRKLSVGTRRESLEIMAGTSVPLISPDSPAPETDRASALDVLEGRAPGAAAADAPLTMQDFAAAFAASLANENERTTRTNGIVASASSGSIAQAGGRGAHDLGMLVEEEEGSDDGDVTQTAPSRTLPTRRPNSLAMPPNPSPANVYGTSSDSPSPSDDGMSSFAPNQRGYRPLSMVSTSATDAPKRGAGLRSLTLSSGAGPSSSAMTPSNSQRRSLMSSTGALPASNAASRAARRISVGPSAAGKHSSISYRPAGPEAIGSAETMHEGDVSIERTQLTARIAGLELDLTTASARQRALEAEVVASQAILRAKEAEMNAVHAQMASLQAELASHGDMGSRVVDLESQIAEASERYNAELVALRERCNDATLERDDLKEDVDGWRSRCADLARALERERARVEEERREGAAAREQVRKLGERLAAASSASAAAKTSADEALAEAQAKLITEMRDQIFSLAGQLERERAAHTATRDGLGKLPAASPIAPASALFVDIDAPTVIDDRESDAGSSIASSTAFRSFNTTADASFSTMASDEVPPSRPSSFSQGKLQQEADHFGLTAPVGGLHTLAEEDEEDEEDEMEAESEDTKVPTLEPSSPAHAFGSAGSICSTASEAMPKTPIKEECTPLPEHRRSHSFLKEWKFPMGSVEQVHIVNPDDNTFFGISQAEILPPLAVPDSALELPAFAMSDLVADPSYDSPIIPRHAPEPVMTSTPPRERSPVAVDEPLANPPVVSRKALSRMSFQNFGNLLSSYVAPPPAPAPKAAAKHGRQDSLLFAGEGDDRPPLLLARTSGRRRTITPAEATRPKPSALSELDFSSSCSCTATRVIRL